MLTLTLCHPRGALPRVLAPHCRGLGTPEPQRWTHPAAPPPPGPRRALPVIQVRRTAGPSEPPAAFEGALRQNAWAHAPACQRPHLGPPLRSLPRQRIRPAGLWGLTLTLRRPPGAPPKGPGATMLGIGDPEPQRRTHPATPMPPRPLGVLPIIQGGRTVRALRGTATFQGPPIQNAGAHVPARQCPHLGKPLFSPHSQQIGPAGILGANPNPRSAPRGPSQEAWRRQPQGIGSPSPSARLNLPPAATRAAKGATGHSGQENGQIPPSNW